MNTTSHTRLAAVHPLLAQKVKLLTDLLAVAGYQFEVVSGLRDFTEQNKLFAQGRTRPGAIVTRARGGQSNHNYGLAVDIAPVRDGKIDWNWRTAFLAINAAAEQVGLEWGGDWTKFVDMPHVQLPGLTVKQCQALYKKGGLAAVWAKFR